MSAWLAGLLVALVVTVGGGAAAAADRLVPLTEPGPWSGVSGLIGYGDRLWFVNSVKFVDHNSADIYSYDPRRGTTRYEAHLFSQDAGDPVVMGRLLYWPFEDPRFSTGRGEYMVTDGRAWRWRILPAGQVFHVHAMAAVGTTLFAATSAWRTGLQRSDDGGATWRIVYEHPASGNGITRITVLTVHDGVLYAGLTAADDGPRLWRLDAGTLAPVPGWPDGLAVDALASYRGWLYGVSVTATGSRLWRTDGRTTTEPVGALDGARIRGLAAGPDALWAITATTAGGALWRSPDGLRWTERQRFDAAEPLAATVYAGRVYVGTRSAGGRGTLWGPPPPAPHAAMEPPACIPPPARGPAPDPATALRALESALADPATYTVHAARLRDLLQPLALDGGADLGVELSRRLVAPAPDLPLRLFGGALTVPAATLARWYLLWAIGLNGHGRVPVPLLQTAWAGTPNRAGKYLEPALAAAWTAARLGQNDAVTLAALVARLGALDEPAWVDGDLVGALTTLSGERFGYDAAAWRRWWASRRRRHE